MMISSLSTRQHRPPLRPLLSSMQMLPWTLRALTEPSSSRQGLWWCPRPSLRWWASPRHTPGVGPPSSLHPLLLLPATVSTTTETGRRTREIEETGGTGPERGGRSLGGHDQDRGRGPGPALRGGGAGVGVEGETTIEIGGAEIEREAPGDTGETPRPARTTGRRAHPTTPSWSADCLSTSPSNT